MILYSTIDIPAYNSKNELAGFALYIHCFRTVGDFTCEIQNMMLFIKHLSLDIQQMFIYSNRFSKSLLFHDPVLISRMTLQIIFKSCIFIIISRKAFSVDIDVYFYSPMKIGIKIHFHARTLCYSFEIMFLP